MVQIQLNLKTIVSERKTHCMKDEHCSKQGYIIAIFLLFGAVDGVLGNIEPSYFDARHHLGEFVEQEPLTAPYVQYL